MKLIPSFVRRFLSRRRYLLRFRLLFIGFTFVKIADNIFSRLENKPLVNTNLSADERYLDMTRLALFRNVGLALSSWSEIERLLVIITSTMLRTTPEKTGIILYSVINFNIWLNIIEELFTLEPDFAPLKPRWNKMKARLRSSKDMRDRLAHHTVWSETLSAELRPGPLDLRAKSLKHKYEPLDAEQILSFIETTSELTKLVVRFRFDMIALRDEGTSLDSSPEPTSAIPPPPSPS